MIVYYPNNWVYRANVLRSASIRDLRVLLPDQSVEFILHGTKLTDSSTFAFCGIKNNDILFVIKNSPNSVLDQKWINMTRESDVLNDRFSCILNPKTTSEAIRLRDMQLSRLERKPRAYRKLCAAALNIDGKSSFGTDDSKPFIIPKTKLEKPMSTPLPVFWSKSTPHKANTISIEESNSDDEKQVQSNPVDSPLKP